jgi:AmmeMemoRadiSam system protein B
MSPTDQPQLRPIEIIPFQSEGQALLCLRDRDDPGARQVILTGAAHLLLALMDGTRDVAALAEDFLRYSGMVVTEPVIANLIETLNTAYLLDNEQSQARLEMLRQEFDKLPIRPAAFAGGAYPGDPAELRGFLQKQYVDPNGPGAGSGSPQAGRQIPAAIIPHVDLHRGGPTYAWAYKALAEAQPASVYIVLGTCHALMSRPFSLLPRSYDTPLGEAPVDLEMVSLLTGLLGEDIAAERYAHRGEHSIEFQAVYLRAIERVGGQTGGTFVPILCQAPQAYTHPGQLPRETLEGADFIGALREAIQRSGRSVCIVAGADLAHVGPQFGDPEPLTADDMQRVRKGDTEMLAHVARGDADGFYHQVMEDDDARRICGLAPIYYTLQTQQPAAGEVLRYTQWLDPTGHSAVTFASVVFPRSARPNSAAGSNRSGSRY